LPQALAQNQSVCTTDLKLVFISDGYKSESDFNSDVESMAAGFKSQAPYSEKPEIFDVRRIYNNIPLGCVRNGKLYTQCLNDATTLAKLNLLTSERYPELRGLNTDYLKFIILADADPESFGNRIRLGVSKGVGGQFAAFQTHYKPLYTAVHEVLGHEIGFLHDRYISPNYHKLFAAPPSNCSGLTTNKYDIWWLNEVPGTELYKGCNSIDLYAPYPRNCNPSEAGYSGSMMSMPSWVETALIPLNRSG